MKGKEGIRKRYSAKEGGGWAESLVSNRDQSANRFCNYGTFIALNDEDLIVELIEDCSISKHHCN